MGRDRNERMAAALGYSGRGGIKGSREIADLNAAMSKEIRMLNRRLNSLPYTLRNTIRQQVMEEAAAPLVERARELAPREKSNRVVTIYAKDRKTGEKTHPVKYYPGNLKKSIQVLRFRRSSDVFVGPKVLSKVRGKQYGKSGSETGHKPNRAVNAFYAHWVEFGRRGNYSTTEYMRPALEQSAQQVLKVAEQKFREQVRRWAVQLQKEGYKSAI